MYWVVAYDITSDQRRQKMLAMLKDYGLPVQRSVVECDLEAARFSQMRDRALQLVHPKLDKIFFYRLCGACWFQAERHGPGWSDLRK